MQRFKKQLWLIGFLLLVSASIGRAQPSVALDSARNKLKAIISQLPDSNSVTVRAIYIKGNKVTREYIVLRELPFKKGSKVVVKELYNLIELGRLNVFNTQLFLEVIPSVINWDQQEFDLVLDLKERWYIFPIPYFKLVDRNFNQWWVEQERSLERTNYGLKFNWENVSGRRDKLSFNYVNGYNRQFSVYYEQPFVDKKLEKGFLAGISYNQTRQMSYAIDSNQQVFFPTNNNAISNFVRSTFRIETGITYRKGVNHRHVIRFHYTSESIADTIPKLIEANGNKGYLPFFTGNSLKQNFGELVYGYNYYNLNNFGYPWKGVAFSGYFSQRGLGAKGMNMWQFTGKVGRYIPFREKTSFALMALGIIKIPFKQPQYNMGALGYGDMFLRGLEYYVIDGVMAGVLKTTIRRELFQVNVPTLLIKNEKYRKIPFKVVAKLYGDLGSSYTTYSTTSYLNNKLLYTWGFGIDILSYYDFAARFDYSFNQLGEKGLFLQMRKDF